MMQRRRLARRDGERGALLLDALVAMTFFGVVLGGWVQLTNMKFKTIGEADRRFRAVQAAESALAKARDGALLPGEFKVGESQGSLRGLEGVLEVKDRDTDGLREVTAKVSWTEPGGRKEDVRVTTLVK